MLSRKLKLNRNAVAANPAVAKRAESNHLADQRLTWSPLNAQFEIIEKREGKILFNPTRRKVVIYGCGSGKEQVVEKLHDPDWDVWCLNLIPAFDRDGHVRADLWWDIHQRCAQTPDDMRWIESVPRPIFVPADLVDAGPNCVRFPYEELEQRFATNYWACTFAYQIATALYLGYTDIGLYGVELSLGTRRERTVEWACVSYWMGFAEARGVAFHLPATTRLGTHPFRYGIEYDAEIADVKAYVESTTPGDVFAIAVERGIDLSDLSDDGKRLDGEKSVGG